MKAIKLSQEQKDKLLEMCKVLFPEYKNHRLCNNLESTEGGDTCSYNDDLIIVNFWDSTDGIPLFVQWFEFCLCHIPIKLKKYGVNIDYWLMTLPSTHCQWPKEFNHPVDYLYSKFKKLEL